MVIVGALFGLVVISSALVLSACMLAGQCDQEFEQADGVSLELNGRWSGTTFGDKYTTRIPHCNFEPEALEDIQVIHRF